MSVTFRDYQTRFVNGLALALTRVRRVVGQLATGGGKTVVFSGICKRYIDANPDKSVLILVHRKKLLKQTRRTLYNAFAIDCQVIIAGMKTVPYARVYVGMVESVTRRIDRIHGIGLVIIDECHIASFNKVQPYFPTQLIIGFTATPLANNKKLPLKGYYDDIVCGIDIVDLIELNKREPGQGLCQNVTFAPKDVVDRAALAVSQSTGDFKEGLMALEFSKPKYIKNAVEAYAKHGKGTKTIVFNVNIEHSKLVCEAFIGAGYDCKHIDSEMTEFEITHISNWFHTTPNAILCNVGILTTGFDEPTIETVMINRSTTSMPLWLQMCGRGSRPVPGKIMFTIIDLGGNAVTHGDWCEPRDWVNIFWNPPKPGEAKDQPAPVKVCPSCEAIIPAPSKTCKFCGYIYPLAQQMPEGDLDELIVVTKGVDVKELIEKNKHKKRYATFYEIGKTLAKNAKGAVKEMTEETAEYIYDQYITKATEWAAEHNHKLAKWHYDEAKKNLYTELQKLFKKWKPKDPKLWLITETPTTEVIQNIEKTEPIQVQVQTTTPIVDAPDFSTFDNYFTVSL